MPSLPSLPSLPIHSPLLWISAWKNYKNESHEAVRLGRGYKINIIPYVGENIFTVSGCSHFLDFYTHGHLLERCLKWLFSSIYVTRQQTGNDIIMSWRILANSKWSERDGEEKMFFRDKASSLVSYHYPLFLISWLCLRFPGLLVRTKNNISKGMRFTNSVDKAKLCDQPSVELS